MEEYLQKMVIVLPATAIAMGGLLLVVFIYTRSQSKGSESTLPLPQCSVTTQVNESLQMNHESLNKLIEEVAERVKSILSEEFRNKQASKISKEEFNNLFVQQRGLDSRGMDAKQVEPAFRIPAVASPAQCAPKTQDSTSLKKSHSFATLWVEELQKSGNFGDSVPIIERENELLDEEPTMDALLSIPPPRHSIVTISSDSSSTTLEPENRDCITKQLGFSEPTYLNVMKSPNELKLRHGLESILLTASLNMCRSITAFSMTQNSGEEITLNSKFALSRVPGCEYLEHIAEAFSSVPSTSMDVPQLLKGGAPTAVDDFETCRLHINENNSPPNTPGWRRPEWKGKYETHHNCNAHIGCETDNQTKGASIYHKPKLHSASAPGVLAYYKSVREEADRRWDSIKNRYREAAERAFERAELRMNIGESAEWRRHLKTLFSDSSSSSESDQQKQDEKSQANDHNRIKSMLTSSSSSSLESDESSGKTRQLNTNPRCKMVHQHCRVFPAADQESSESSSG